MRTTTILAWLAFGCSPDPAQVFADGESADGAAPASDGECVRDVALGDDPCAGLVYAYDAVKGCCGDATGGAAMIAITGQTTSCSLACARSIAALPCADFTSNACPAGCEAECAVPPPAP